MSNSDKIKFGSMDAILGIETKLCPCGITYYYLKPKIDKKNKYSQKLAPIICPYCQEDPTRRKKYEGHRRSQKANNRTRHPRNHR